MPPRIRPLLENPIVMGILWCMHCLRTALAEWDPAYNDWPIQIECVRDAKASVMCRQCSARNALCFPVATAMIGDGHDLAVLLSWAREMFWVGQIDPSDPGSFVDWLFPAEARLIIAGLMQDLC
ncbi:hypothetical protein PMG11_11410 [Penicillium brasilianum]|uniref:Uncharacterized protein n=1 Tax=Penicillium brasilianum TaxID=104259 RepID=A0A0F7U555_PENBI|nr:hypothetical protein PMG11_11410 [Penicillium brasilianum]